jgi:Concanavalin A-like lectin/glucanases superfamily/Bacterial Ig domain
VVAVDNSGHTSPDSNAAQAIIEPDTTPPVGSLGVCNGVTLKDYPLLRVSWEDDRGPVTRRIYLDGNLIFGPETHGGLGSHLWEWETQHVPNGLHLMTMQLVDGAGNETTVPCEWNVHNPVITVPFVSPGDGDTVGGTATLKAEPRADGQPITGFPFTHVQYEIDGSSVGSGSLSQSFQTTWDTTEVANGLHIVTAKVYRYDYSTPRATSTIQVRVDNSPPAPTGVRTEVRGDDVDVLWDPIPGVNQYHVYRDGTKIGSTTGTGLTDGDRPAGTYRYQVTGQQYNAEGPRSEEATATVVAPPDTPPTVTLASNCNGATVHDYITLRPTWSDDKGPVTVTIKVDGQIIRGPDNGGTSGSYMFDWETQGLPNGTHVMQAIARDGAGNESVATCNWNVHNPAVTLPFTSHSDGDTVRGTVLIKTQPLGDGQPLAREAMVVRLSATGPASATDPTYFDKDWSWDTTQVPDGLYTINAAVTWMGYHRDFATSTIHLQVDNVDTEPPTAPELSATVEADGVHLSWTESQDRGPVTYEVYRYYDRTDRIAGVGGAREYVDSADLPEATYRYSVAATDSAGNRVTSNRFDVRIGEPDLEPPTAPELTVVANSLSATLTWTASTDDRGLKEYGIYRNGQAVQFLPPVGPREATFTLAAGTYTFKVYAVDKAQKLSEFSNEVTVTLAAPTTHAPWISAATLALDNNDVRVQWGEAIGNAPISEYRLYRDDTLIQSAGASARSYLDVNMAPGTYRYRVVAIDTAGGTLTSGDSPETIAPDTSAPAATLSTACGTVRGTVDVRGTITDDRGPFAWRLELDGQTIAGPFDVTEPTASIQRAWDTTAAADGSHELTLVVRDESGNETETAPCTVNVQNVVPSGLVAAYGFEHTSGTTATDSSGKGGTGTISGATSVADGRFGRALSFDGSNDMVTAADSNALDLAPGMTLSAWVRPTTVNDWRTVLLKERPGQLAYALYASTDNGRPMTEITVSGQRDARGTAALPVGVWSHLAATYDGANVRLFVNSTQVASAAATGTLFNSAGALRIGGNAVWGEYFSGLIDEVRVYERAFSAAEIQADRDRAVVLGT